MIRNIAAHFGLGYGDVGYRLFDLEAFVGDRVAVGITDPTGQGIYVAQIEDTGIVGVLWDATGEGLEYKSEVFSTYERAILQDVNILISRFSAERALLLDKLNVGEAEEPVYVIPEPPGVGLCRVYGWVKDVTGEEIVGVKIQFALTPSNVNSDGAVIHERLKEVETDEEGYPH